MKSRIKLSVEIFYEVEGEFGEKFIKDLKNNEGDTIRDLELEDFLSYNCDFSDNEVEKVWYVESVEEV